MNISQVLVVDDDEAVCRIVHRMLSGDEHEVRATNSVAAALKIIEQESFDVYVLNYKLPDGSGLDVAGRIREKRGAAPIILMSATTPVLSPQEQGSFVSLNSSNNPSREKHCVKQ